MSNRKTAKNQTINDISNEKLSNFMKEKQILPAFIPPEKKLRVAIIGCTGLVGQTIVDALIDHPWFRIHSLHGFKSIGKTYGKARKGQRSHAHALPQPLDQLVVQKVDEIDLDAIDLVFSAIPSEFAEDIEKCLAQTLPVFSTASWSRYLPDVPIFLPIVNGPHRELIHHQQQSRNWKGFLCPGPNCTSVGPAVTLYPILQQFGLTSVHLVSMQAISGAGYGGVAAYDIQGNVIPHIPEEENKVQRELKKILSKPRANVGSGSHDSNLDIPKFDLDCKCNRVPVLNGHLISLFIQTRDEVSEQDLRTCLQNFQGHTAGLSLPNAPEYPIHLFSPEDIYRPQPRIEFSASSTPGSGHLEGMKTYVGGFTASAFSNGFKLTILSHNTELGAGRGAVLNAEYLYRQGILTENVKVKGGS
ncbi:MAG: aspartate-semialdehyde dehydrogenase [Promethearchaeota archaeon]